MLQCFQSSQCWLKAKYKNTEGNKVRLLFLLLVITGQAFAGQGESQSLEYKERVEAQIAKWPKRELFTEKLRKTEQQQRENAESKAHTLSDTDYKALLKQKVDQEWGNREMVDAVTIIDVTKEVAQQGTQLKTHKSHNVPVAKLSSASSLGLAKINKILDNVSQSTVNTGSSKQLSASKDAKLIVDNLQLMDRYYPDDQKKVSEQISLTINRTAANALLNSNSITDLQVKGVNTRGAISFSTINTVKGRFIRYPEPVKHDPQFLKDGWYKELKESFSEPRIVNIKVVLPSYTYNENDSVEMRTREIAASKKLADEVMSDLESYLHVEHDRVSGLITLVCHENVVDVLYSDQRVSAVVDSDTYYTDALNTTTITNAVKEKYYKKLKALFRAPKRLEILVHLAEHDMSSDWTQEDEIKSKKLVDSILGQFNDADYQVEDIGYFSFSIIASEKIADALYKDERVKSLNDAQLASSQSQISIR